MLPTIFKVLVSVMKAQLHNNCRCAVFRVDVTQGFSVHYWNQIADCMLRLQEDDDNMYTSIQELRDEADELQLTMDECERCGDLAQLEQLQQKLQQTQSKLLEKNEERHLARYFETVISVCPLCSG